MSGLQAASIEDEDQRVCSNRWHVTAHHSVYSHCRCMLLFMFMCSNSVTAGSQGRMRCSVEAVAGSVLEQYSDVACPIVSHVIDVEKFLSH